VHLEHSKIINIKQSSQENVQKNLLLENRKHKLANFSEFAGMWKDQDIDKKTLRKKAMRDISQKYDSNTQQKL